MFESKKHPGRVMVLCVATGGFDDMRNKAIERSMNRLAERLETEVDTLSISPVLWDFRSRFILVAELRCKMDREFASMASRVCSLSELGELRRLAAVECDFLIPTFDSAAASIIAAGRPVNGESTSLTIVNPHQSERFR
jgi:hypothetical protein